VGGCGGSTSAATSSPTSGLPSSSPTASSPSPNPSTTVKTVSPAGYLHVLCAAFTAYPKRINAAATKFQKAVTRAGGQGDLGGLKRGFVGFLGESVSITRATHDVIAKAGTPDVSRGAAVQRAVLGALQQFADRFAKIKGQAAKTDDTNATTFFKQIHRLDSKLKKAGAGIGAGLDSKPLTDPALDKAAAKIPSCAVLN
jgi:hypothetical protein